MQIETQIINQLLHNEKFTRAVLPYLEKEYFAESGNQVIFEQIQQYVGQYKSYPTVTAIEVQVASLRLPELQFESANEAIASQKVNQPVDMEWMIKNTEAYCQDRALDLALRESIQLREEPGERGRIPDVLRKALSISFDSELGHSWRDDAEARYDKLHSVTNKIPFSLETFNKATEGGVEHKTINVIIAGCVHPDTPVHLRYEFEGVERYIREAPISRVKELLNESSFVEVSSAHGWAPIKEYVEKGSYQQYVVSIEGRRQTIQVNADHLVETSFGWMTAHEMMLFTNQQKAVHVRTYHGWAKATCVRTDYMIPIVDIVIGADHHSYYANGISSHNTNVGKSLMLCQLAADYIMQGRKVVYFTMEMSEEKISQRIDANLVDVDLKDHPSMPKAWFLKRIDELKSKTQGDVRVKEYPISSAHVGHFRHFIQELILKDKFVPEIIIVDYLNICASSKHKAGSVARHLYVQSITEELRALGQEFKAAVWTAAQTNREGFGSSDPDMTNSAEAFGLNFAADFVVVISQPEELEELNQFLVRQEKSRYADKGAMRKFFIGVDKQKQRLYDLDISQTRDPEDFPDEDETKVTRNFFEKH